MGQIVHGSATTTHAIRTAIPRSAAPLKELAAQRGLDQCNTALITRALDAHPPLQAEIDAAIAARGRY